jgi:hypothetical protein
MLIKFALVPEQLSSIDPAVLENIVSELLRAHRHGFHLLVLSRQAAEFLCKHITLAPRDLALLQRLSSEYTQTGTLWRRASTYLEVSIDSHFDLRDNAIITPITYLGPANIGQPGGLLIEDAHNDGFVIDFILRNVRDIFGAPRSSFVLQHGGGGGLVRRFEEAVELRSITLCILDTDMKSPRDNLCAVSRKVLAACSPTWPPVIAKTLPCHEIENVIPHEVLRMLRCAEGCNWNTFVPMVEAWEETTSIPRTERFWLFFDVKGGLSSEAASKINPLDKKWLDDRLKIAGLTAAPWIHTGYGTNVISCLRVDNAAQAELRRHVRSKNWLAVFSPMCSQLLWFFASAVPLIT